MRNEVSIQELKQPPVLKLAVFSTMCERFGFYVLTFLLVLFLKSEYQFSDSIAFVTFGAFTALAYVTTTIGGYLADNVFGIRRCIIFGLIAEASGLMLLAIPNKAILSFALALIVVGVGLFKTGPTHLMGRSYKEKDPRIDSGFTLYYMGMNIGSVFSSFLMGIVQKYYGWHVTFFFAGLGIFLGLVFYYMFRKAAENLDSAPGRTSISIKVWLSVIAGIVIAITGSIVLLAHPASIGTFLVLATLILLGYFVYEIIKSPKEEKLKIIACLALITMGLVFFILYQQAFMSMTLFINRNVNRSLLGFELPTVFFLGLNPIWVIILGPVLASLYNYWGKKNKDPAVTLKFPIGLLLTSLCFFTMAIGGHFANDQYLVSPWWIVLAYFFYTAGEMLVSALGVAMVTHIAPRRMYGVMMGTWFVVGMSLSAFLGSMFAGIASVPDSLHDNLAILQIYEKAFLEIGAGALVLTVISFIAGPFIKKIAKLD